MKILFTILIKVLTFWVLTIQFPQEGTSQVFLQLEKFNSPKTIKFVEGDELEFRIHAYPKTWRRGVLEKILIEEETIVLDGDFFQLEELKDVRIERPWAKYLGRTFIQFAGAWFAYAIVIDVFNIGSLFGQEFEIGTDTLLVGGAAFGLGLFIRKVFGKKKFKLGKNSRLRLLDISF